jgi:hypothetical protein
MGDNESSDGGAPPADNQDGGTPPPASTDGGAPPPASTDAGTSSTAGTDGGATPADAGTQSDSGASTDDSATPVDAARGDNTNTTADPVNITLQVQCGHTTSGIRQEAGNPGADGRLMIVPSSGQTTVGTTLTCMGGGLKINATVNSGGTDAMQATISDNSGNGVPNPQIAITQNDPPADSDWVTGMTATQSIPTPGDTGLWLGSAQAATWKVFARGNPDDTPVVVEVDAYPAYSLSGSISTDFFQQMLNDFTDGYKQMMSNLPIQVTPVFQAPTGSLQVSCGWAENTDWQAYYAWKITGQLNPLFGVGVKFSANALALAGMMVDIPPSLTQYLGAIILSFEIDGAVSIGVNYGCTGPSTNTGSFTPTGGISVTVAGEARAGDKKLASADAILSGTAGINWNGTLTSPSAGGVLLQHNLQFTGVVASFKLNFTAFGVESKNAVQQSFTVWQGGTANLKDYILIDPAGTTS